MTLPPDRTWRVDVRPGAVNDTLATMLYRRTGDPRGWPCPDDYAAPRPGEKDYDPVWVDRDALDDADDPPFLAVRAPGSAGLDHDMTRVPDTERERAFQGEDEWDLEVWRAHVLLSASPVAVPGIPTAAFPPPRLARYRLAVLARLPSPTFGARLGGWLELATLYLLRDPSSPEDAEMLVRQREFWPLWASIVQPGANLPGLIQPQTLDLVTGLPFADFAVAGFNAMNQLLADAARAELETTLEGASSVDWWTV